MNTRYVRELEKYIGMIGPRDGGKSKLPLSCRIDGCSREVFTCYAPAILSPASCCGLMLPVLMRFGRLLRGIEPKTARLARRPGPFLFIIACTTSLPRFRSALFYFPGSVRFNDTISHDPVTISFSLSLRRHLFSDQSIPSSPLFYSCPSICPRASLIAPNNPSSRSCPLFIFIPSLLL